MDTDKLNGSKKKLKRRRRESIVYPILKHETDRDKDIHIDNKEFSIGRGADNNCILADLAISRSQCMFSLRQRTSEWYLTDTSNSGTFLNNVALKIAVPTLVKDGDEIRFTTVTTITMGKIYIYTFTCDCKPSSAKIMNEEIGSIKTEDAIENQPLMEPEIHCKIEAVDHSDDNNVLLEIAELKQTIQQQAATIQQQIEKYDELIQQNMIVAQDTAKFRECAETNMSCPICNEIFITPIILNCSHIFCGSCISQWKQNKKRCPMCRAIITSEKKTFLFDNLIESFHATATEEVRNKRQEVVEERSVQEILSNPATKASSSRGRRRSNRNSQVITLDDSISPAHLPIEPIEIYSDELDEEEDDAIDDFFDLLGDYTDSDSYSYSDDESHAGLPQARRRDVYIEGIPGEAYGGYGYCYRCGANGHWAPGCPER